jgi:DNA-binding CsgD family transcriptional regulator
MNDKLNGHEDALVLRTNADGEVVGMNGRAEGVIGCRAIGKSCHLAVGGLTMDGAPICRPGCAQELARGSGVPPKTREARVRNRRVALRCFRVGNETIVVADPLESATQANRLTAREAEVLALVAEGLSGAMISERLGISKATVRTHVEHARGRLGASTRAEAVMRAIETGQLRRG